MARAIEKGATYLDKLCHKLYDEPKGRGFQVDGKCRRCGGPLMTYYCEDRLHLIACEKCGTLALTKAVSPQVAANLTLRQPTLTPPNEPLTWNELGNMVEKPVYIVELEDGESCWVLVHTVDDIKALFVSAFDQYDYGNRELYGQTWLAYRRLPEGEANA